LKTRNEKILFFGFILSSLLVLYFLLSHQSPNPWIWGLYSLPYFILIIFILSSLLYIGILISLYRLKAFYILAANLAVLIGLAVIIEIGGQVYAHLNPSYKIIPFMPDPILGWKMIPNSQHIVSGHHWYAREFDSIVKVNSSGFRDHERKIEKEKNTVRIALIGDSMITAREVDFEKTAGQVLEKKLNRELTPNTKKNYEVLNFGVPGYGIDQMFYNWRNTVSKFKPDLVFLYVFEKNYLRTISSNWCSRNFFGIHNLGERKCLFIRPLATIKKTAPGIVTLKESQNFKMDFLYIRSDKLEAIKALLKSRNYPQAFLFLKNLPANIYKPSEYKKFVDEQKIYIEKEMNGQRMIKQPKEVFLFDIFKNTVKQLEAKQLLKEHNSKHEGSEDIKYKGDTDSFPTWPTTNLVNLKLIQFLNEQIQASGGKLTIIDTLQFHNRSISPLTYSSNLLEQLATNEHMEYMPLYKTLNKARNAGSSLIWKYDSHLNELGNEIFANSLFNNVKKSSIQN
jgi:hypothetical protein